MSTQGRLDLVDTSGVNAEEAGEEAGSRVGLTTGYQELQQPSGMWAQAGNNPCLGRKMGLWVCWQSRDRRAPRWSITHRSHQWGWEHRTTGSFGAEAVGSGIFLV